MRDGTLNQEEFYKLSCYLAVDNNIKDKMIVGILSSTNMRLKELTTLKISDMTIKNENGTFECRNIKIERKGVVAHIDIDEGLSRVISDYLIFRSYKALAHDYLLFSERKQPFTRSGIYRRIKNILIQSSLYDSTIRSIKSCALTK